MNDKELWELMSIICEGQDSEQRRKVEQYITDLQEEIERLNKCYCERTDCGGRLKHSRKFNSVAEENERLNNIINELEKSLKEWMQNYNYLYEITKEDEALDIYSVYKYVFNKLQELKGSEKE